jgi:putative addiction module component (TIGR02574 family)
MSDTLKALGLDQLSVEKRLALVMDLWDSIAAEVEQAALTEAQRQEIDRRLAAHKANPRAAIPWEQVEADSLAIRPARKPRAGWADAFKEMAKQGGDTLLDDTPPGL